VIDPVVQGKRDDTVEAPVIPHVDTVFDSASVAENVPVATVNESAAAVSRKFNVNVVITGASFAAVMDTVKVAFVVWNPSVTVTV
jgi:hypothetical protein